MNIFKNCILLIFLYSPLNHVSVVVGANTPPHLSFNREWKLPENEPLGSVVDRIVVKDDDDDDVHLSLVDPNFTGPQLLSNGFSFFTIDEENRVLLKKSLQGLAGQSFLVGIRASDGGIRTRSDVRVSIRKAREKPKPPERLGHSVSLGPPPPTELSHIVPGSGGPPLLNMSPNTVWKVTANASVGTFVEKVEAQDLSNTFLRFSLHPSNLLSIGAESGEVSVSASLLDKIGIHSLQVIVSNEESDLTEDVTLKIIPTDGGPLPNHVKTIPKTHFTHRANKDGPRRHRPRKPTITIIEKATPGEEVSTKEKDHEVSWTTVFIVVLCLFVAVIACGAILFWRRRLKSRAVSKENSVTFTKKLSHGTEDIEAPREGFFTEIFSLVNHKRANNNSYENDTKKPKVPNRESSKSQKVIPLTAGDPDLWEFSRHKLRFVGILGEGCFGQVWKCEATDMEGAGENKNLVAVKTLKESSGAEEQKDLLQELKVLKGLASHPNVVSLLGCCTEKDPIFVILEYMSEGKLQSYLRASRASTFYRNLHGKSSSLTPKDLTIFALQIAKGMDFLSKNKIVHRDLAARNVLVGDDKICKVADFGFARDVTTNHVYERKSDGRMPIRWMAPESLHDNIFTTKSDVWSFGILLWEIVTLGSTPYPGMSAAEVMKKVKEGYRLEKPEHCRREIYNIMYYCWDADEKDRPSFTELVENLDSLIMTEVEYIRLDNFPNRSYYNFTTTYASGELL